jgi:choice-of-anchor A domain-containing protein/RHS repeat-associated protein
MSRQDFWGVLDRSLVSKMVHMNNARHRWANTASGRVKRLISKLKSDLATWKTPAFSIENLEQRQLMTTSPFDFNELVFGNDTRSYTDVQGRVAVGGTGNFTGFSVGTSLSDSDGTRDDLIVGGNLTYTNGQIFNGNVRSGGTATLSSWGHPNGSYIAGNPLNFTDLKSQATSTSSYLAGLATTNSSTFQYGTLTLTGTKAVSVINVSGSQLSTANSINLSAPAGGVLVLNVSGTSDKMQYAGMNLSGTTNSNVIWNFYEATTLTIAGIGVKGTVLAPNATVSFSNGNIDGSLIANNVSGSGEIHYHLYTGPQGQTSVFNPVPVITGTPSGNTSPEGTQISLGSTVSEQNYSGSFTYAWSVTKNGSAYSTATTSGFSFTPNDNGTYVVSLVATDTAGRTGSTSTTVNVTNLAPTASISGPGSGNEGTSVTYTSSKSDPGSADTHTYAWSVLKGGNAYTLPGGTVTNQSGFTFTPSDDGTYTVRLTVTDDDGGSVTTTSSLAVANVARTPSITGASTTNEGSTYTLSLTPGTDPGADSVTSWLINWGDGNTQTITGNPSTATHVYADGSSTYTISASVTDEDGTYSANTLSLTVNNVAPTVAISGAATVNEGSQYTLTLSASNDPGQDTISSWFIDWGDGNTQSVTGNVTTLTHTYLQGPSSVTVKAWASDEDGTYASNTLSLSVLNVAPTGTITGAPTAPIEIGTSVTLGSTVTDPGTLDTHTFAWVITKDGNAYNPSSSTTLNASTLSWTPTTPGAYQITLTVTDDDSASSTPSTISLSVYVTLGVSLTLPTGQNDEGSQVSILSTLSGSASGTATYAWTITKDGNAYNPPSGTALDQSTLAWTPQDNGIYALSLTVTRQGITASTTGSIVVENVDPTATIVGAPSTSPEGTQISLTSTLTDPGSADTHTYAWSVLKDGLAHTLPSGTLTNADTFAFIPTDDGEYEVILTVTDDDGGTSTTSQSIQVTNVAPNVTISGSPSVNEGSAYTLTLSAAADPGSDTITTWEINWGDGSTQTITGNITSLTHTYADGDSTYTIQAWATDEDDTFASNELDVDVLNVAPTVQITGAPTGQVGIGTQVSLGTTVTDPGTPDTFTYAWSITKDGNAYNPGSGTPLDQSTLSWTVSAPGNYVVTLIVTDDDAGVSLPASVNVDAYATLGVSLNLPSGQQDEGSPATVGSSVTGTATGTVTYAWTITKDGNAYNPPSGTALDQSTLQWTPQDNGVFGIELTITRQSLTATASGYVVVENVNPSAQIIDAPTESPEGTHITVTSQISDPGSADTHTYAWSVLKDGQAHALPLGTATEEDAFTFTPTDDGLYTLILTVTDDDGGFTTVSQTVEVTNVAPEIVISGNATVNEGSTYTLSLNAGSDPGSDAVSSWTINWGDGNTDTLTGNPATATHIYADGANSYEIIAYATDEDGSYDSNTVEVSVLNVAPEISISGNATINEGSTYTLTLNDGSDPGDDAVTTWEINWGDGTTQTITGNPTSVTHIYADGANSYEITAYATDQDGTYTANTLDITVSNVAPEVQISGPSTINEGATYTLSLSAGNDPGDDTIASWEINWGDGTTQTITGNPSSVTHVYADGYAEHQISATASDEDGSYDSNTLDITVSNVAPEIQISGPSTIAEGSTYTLTLNPGTDPGDDTIASWEINWGDGSVDTITGNPTSITHVYADGYAEYQISATVTDEDGTYDSNTLDITVSNVAPEVSITGPSTINEGATYTLTLNPGNDPGDDSITEWEINWGDGTTETITGNPATVTHVYTDGYAEYQITATATDEDGTYDSNTLDVSVQNVAPEISISGPSVVAEGAAYTLTLNPGNDPGDDSVSGWTINWGDGNIETLTGNPSTATHVYADGNNTYQISAIATDEDGDYNSNTLNLSVMNVAPTVTLTGAATVDANQPYSLTLNAGNDPGSDSVTSWTINWGDGSTPQVVTATGNTLTITHTYTSVGSNTISASATDEDGTYQGNTLSVDVTQVNTGSYVLVEHTRFITEHRYTLTVPSGVQALSLGYTGLSFDSTDSGRINDAFEVALVDAQGRPLVAMIQGSRDAFANLTQGQSIAVGASAMVDTANGQIIVDVRGIAPGTQITLIARLVNNDADNATTVTLDYNPSWLMTSPIAAPSTSISPAWDSPSAPVDLSLLSDVTASFNATYKQTSFNDRANVLYAGLTLTNAGSFAIRSTPSARLLVAVKNISDPTVKLFTPDGYLPDGTPYLDITDLAFTTTNDNLNPGESVSGIDLRFINPGNNRFTYELQILGHLNQAPSFTTTPPSLGTSVSTAVLPGKSFTYNAQALDPDTDTLTYTLLAGPNGLTIDDVTGLVSWAVPNTAAGQPGDPRGSHSVILQATDPFGLTTTQSFTIHVGDTPNRPPVFVSTPVTHHFFQDGIAGGGAKGQFIELVPNDVGSTSSTKFSPVPTVDPALFGFDPYRTVTVNFDVDPLGNGLHTGNYKDDTYASIGMTTKNVTIGSVYEGPSSNPNATVTPFDNGYQQIFYFSVPVLAVGHVNTSPDRQIMEVYSTEGELLFRGMDQESVPSPNFGVDRFLAFRAPDGQTIGKMVLINTAGQHELDDVIFEVNKTGTPYLYPSQAVDPDGDPITYSLVSGQFPTGMVINETTGKITWNPRLDQTGEFNVSVKASDGKGSFALQSFTVTAEYFNPNTAPIFNSTPRTTTNLAHPYEYKAAAYDRNTTDTLVYSLSGGAHGATINPTTGLLTWNPSAYGSYAFTIVATDNKGAATAQAFSVDVTDAASVTGTAKWYTVGVVSPVQLPLKGVGITITGEGISRSILTDSAGRFSFDGLTPGTYTLHQEISGLPGWSVETPSGGTWTVTVGLDENKTANFLTAITPVGALSSPVLQSPIAGVATVGVPYRYTLDPVDPDGPDVFVTLGIVPPGMTLDSDGRTLLWTPTASDLGDHDLFIKLTDTNNGVTVIKTSIRVSDSNLAPVITSTPSTATGLGNTWTYQATAQDENGDPIRYALDQASLDRGITIDAATGALSWLPGVAGLYSIEVSASDGRGGLATQVFKLTVGNNTAPVFQGTPTSFVAFVGQAWTYAASATDPDLDTVTFQLLSGPQGMSLTGANLDTLSWTPDVSLLGQEVTVSLAADDGRGGRSVRSFKLLVQSAELVNDTPVITTTPSQSIRAGQAYSYNVDAVDANADALTYALDADSINRGMSIDSATGVISWAGGTYGTYAVTVSVSDGRGGVVQQAYDLVVLANQAPTFTSQPADAAYPNQPWKYRLTGTDPEGDILTFSIVEGPLDATLTSGLLEWTPATGDAGQTITFKLGVTDSKGASTQQTVTLTVGQAPSQNESPLFLTGPAIAARQYRPLSYQPLTVDPNGDTLVYSLDLDSLALGLQIDSGTGLLTWASPTTGTHEIVITADDLSGGIAQQTITLAVAPNAGPTFLSTPASTVVRGTQWSYTPSASDPESDSFTLSLGSSIPSGLTLVAGKLTWTPGINQPAGPVTFDVKATDSFGIVTTQAITLDVVAAGEANQAPTFTSTPGNPVQPNVTYTYLAKAVDPNNDPVYYTLDSDSAALGISIDPDTGRLTWANPTSGQHPITVTASDGVLSTKQSFSLYVLENTAPVVTTVPTGSLPLSQAFTFTITASDPNPTDTFTFTLDQASLLRGMTIDPVTGLLSWTPAATGNFDTTVSATDSRGAVSTRSFSLRVVDTNAPNLAPGFTSQAPSVIQPGQAYFYQPVATDPNGDPITFTLDQAPAGMTIDAAGFITWRPAASDLGTPGTLHHIKLLASDGRSGVTAQEFDIQVVSVHVNSAPEITSGSTASVTAGRLLSYQAQATDVDHDVIVWSLISAPSGVVLNAQTGLLQWVPTVAQAGSQPITIQAIDAYGARTQHTVTVQVRAGNAPPLIVSIPPTSALENSTYHYQAAATDPNGDPLTFTLLDGPANATVNPSTGLITWDTTGYTDPSYLFILQVSDGEMSSAQGFEVVLTSDASETNTAPQISSQPIRAAKTGGAYSYQVVASDPENQTLTYSLSTTASGLSIDPDTGLVTWNPVGATGTASVTVTATDTFGLATSQTYALTVYSATPPTVQTLAPVNIVAGQQASFVIVGQSVAIPGGKLTYTLDSSAPAGLTVGAAGHVTWQTTGANIGSYAFSVLVTDPAGNQTAAPVTLTVTADAQGPSLSLIPGVSPVFLGQSVPFFVNATDNVGVKSLTLSTNGTPLAIDREGTSEWTPDHAGTFSVVLTAEDAAGNVTSKVITIQVIDANDINAPSVSINSPGAVDSANPTANEVSQTTPIIVTISDTDSTSVNYLLKIARIVGTEPGGAPILGDWRTLATGSGFKAAQSLATIDPTSMADGSYILELSATDPNGNSSTDFRRIEVQSGPKLGNFSISATDLTANVAGLPVSITRTYDSLFSDTSGDFGHGWRLDLFGMTVESDALRIASGNGNGTDFIDPYAPFFDGTRIYVTLPGGQRQAFTFVAKPLDPPAGAQGVAGIFSASLLYNAGFAQPQFIPDPGNTSTLELATDLTLFRRADGTYGVTGGDFNFNPSSEWFDADWVMTTQDGTRYTVDDDSGKLTSISDRNGNHIEQNDGGIFSVAADGTVLGGIQLTRDFKNRITSAQEIGANGATLGPAITYAYNAAGDLITVTDRSDASVTYGYGPDVAHLLTSITDARGVLVMQNTFDPVTGRLTKITDASGNSAPFSYNTNLPGGQRAEVVADAIGAKTIAVRDTRGNLIRKIQEVSTNSTETRYLVTTMKYDLVGPVSAHSDRLTSTSQSFTVVDNLATSSDDDAIYTASPLVWNGTQTYDKYGQVIASTDVLGNTSYMSYDKFGNVTSSVDALGNVTSNAYDDRGNITSSTDALGNTTRYQYDPSGRLIKMIDVLGNETTSAYDGEGRLTSSTDASGITRYFDYDANGRQNGTHFTWVNPANSSNTKTLTTTTVYDDDGRVISSTDATGNSSSTQYNKAGQVVSTTNRFGGVSLSFYDSRGLLIESRSSSVSASGTSGWMVSRTSYDANGRAVYSTDATFELDPDNAPIATTGSRTTYDALGRAIVSERVEGLLLDTSPTANPNVYSVTVDVSDLDILTAGYTYFDDAGRVNKSVSPTGSTSETVYNAIGQQLQVIADEDGNPLTTADRNTTTYTYDSFGRQKTVTDALSRTTTFLYDELGRVQTTILPDSSTSGSVTYDDFGRKISETDRMGRVTRYEYDQLGRQKAVILPEVKPAQPFTNPDGQGFVTPTYTYGYDVYGNQTTITDPLGHTTRFTFDEFGREVARQLPLGVQSGDPTAYVQRTVYIQSGVLAGQVQYTVSYEGVVTSFVYDTSAESGGRLLEKRFYTSLTNYQNNPSTPAQYVKYTYTDEGQIDAITQDADGNAATTADQRVEAYLYDARHQLITKSSPEGVIHYEYNDLGQQTRTYTTATLASSAVLTDTRYTFDNYGRMKTVESWASAGVTHAAPQITTYVYDLIGRLSEITYANGVTGVYTYDMLDRLDKLTQYLPDSSPGDLSDNVIAAEYDYTVALDGTRTALAEMVLRDAAAGGGYAVSYYTWTYDNLNRLMSEVITSTEPGVSRTEHYAYDLSGNRIYKGAVRYQGYGYNNATMYTYDANDRLEVETYQSSNPANFEDTWSDKYYTYGSNGQSTYATQVTESRSVMSSKYDETTGYDVWYTKDTSTTTHYAFNLEARMSGQSESTSVYERWEYYNNVSEDFHTENKNSSNSSSASFTYDDSGIRVYASQVTTDTAGVSQATATLYLVDAMNPTGYAQVLEERTATAAGTTVPYVDALMAVSKAYVLGMDVVQQWTPANLGSGLPTADNLVILPDGHGSTRLLLASTAGVVASGLLIPGQRFFFDAWGNTLAPVGAPAPLTTLLYTGEQRDTTGMYYLRARYYNPGLGRFSSMDLWEDRHQSIENYNGYLFGEANPINRTDFTGNYTCLQDVLVTQKEITTLRKMEAARAHSTLMMGRTLSIRMTTYRNTQNMLYGDMQSILGGGAYNKTLFSQYVTANQNASLALNDLITSGRINLHQALNIPIFFVFKILYDEVWTHRVSALASEPLWYLLRRHPHDQKFTNKQRRLAQGQYTLPYNTNRNDLDEYPYAETTQGGLGASVTPVLRSQNRSEGSHFGWFLDRYVTKSQPFFFVIPVPIQ